MGKERISRSTKRDFEDIRIPDLSRKTRVSEASKAVQETKIEAGISKLYQLRKEHKSDEQITDALIADGMSPLDMVMVFAAEADTKEKYAKQTVVERSDVSPAVVIEHMQQSSSDTQPPEPPATPEPTPEPTTAPKSQVIEPQAPSSPQNDVPLQQPSGDSEAKSAVSKVEMQSDQTRQKETPEERAARLAKKKEDETIADFAHWIVRARKEGQTKERIEQKIGKDFPKEVIDKMLDAADDIQNQIEIRQKAKKAMRILRASLTRPEPDSKAAEHTRADASDVVVKEESPLTSNAAVPLLGYTKRREKSALPSYPTIHLGMTADTEDMPSAPVSGPIAVTPDLAIAQAAKPKKPVRKPKTLGVPKSPADITDVEPKPTVKRKPAKKVAPEAHVRISADVEPKPSGLPMVSSEGENIAESMAPYPYIPLEGMYDSPEMEAERVKNDQAHRLLERIAAEGFDIEDLHFSYTTRVPSNTTPEGEQVTLTNYRDFRTARAKLTPEQREEVTTDSKGFEYPKYDKRAGFTGSSAALANLHDRLFDPNDPLSKYKDEFISLEETAVRGLIPDLYAEAVLRGEVTPLKDGAEDKDVDESGRVNPYTVNPDAQADFDALKSDIHASEDQRKIDEEIEKFKASGLMEPMPEITAHEEPIADEGDDTTVVEKEALTYTPESEFERPSPDDETVRTLGEKGTHRKWGDDEDIEHTDVPGSSDDTHKEGMSLLRRTIEAAKGKLYDAKEKVDWYKSSEEGLIRRNAELDAQAENIGSVETLFRSMGERYNKLSFTKKALIGAGLGLGAVLTAGSIAMVIPMLGVGAQRLAGFSSMYLKFEKKSHDEAWGKNKDWGKQKALLKAGLYTALVGLTMKEAIEYASQTDVAHAMQSKVSEFAHGASEKVTGWLGSILHQEYDANGNPIIPPNAAPASGPVTDAPPHASAVMPEAMKIDVGASKGHGYEYMTKRLWEQLQEKHVSLPAGANPDSDLAKLLAADKDTIDRVVHQLAQENKFFNADGTSVLITPDSHIHLDSNGNILIQGSTMTPEGGNLAPTDADITPAVHLEVAATDVPVVSEGITETETVVSTPTDVPFAHPDFPVSDTNVSAELPPVVDHDFVVNAHEVTVPLAETHIYSDGKDVMMYGGLPKDQQPAILKYLTAHPDATLFSGEDTGKYRVSWRLVEGKLVRGEPEKMKGLLGLFGSFAPPPAPEEFIKVVE